MDINYWVIIIILLFIFIFLLWLILPLPVCNSPNYQGDGLGTVYHRHRRATRSEGSINEYVGISEIIDTVWKNLPIGYVLYNPSSEMRVGVEERVEVRIANKTTEYLIKDLKGKGSPQIEAIKVSHRMKVRLEGDAFDIKSLFTSEDMAIVGEYTEWEWDVIPLKSGVQKLELCVDVVIEVPHLTDRIKHLPVLEKTITVKVNPTYHVAKFIECHWKWIITTAIAIAGAVIALFTYWAKK